MRYTKYDVIFLNGHEDVFYSYNLIGAFCAATHYMLNKGRDSRIKSIEDEYGNVYKDFQLTYTTN